MDMQTSMIIGSLIGFVLAVVIKEIVGLYDKKLSVETAEQRAMEQLQQTGNKIVAMLAEIREDKGEVAQLRSELQQAQDKLQDT